MGVAASTAAFLLCAGASGKRMALPNACIMTHQSSGRATGQATDIEIQAKELLVIDEQINRIMAERTGQPHDKIKVDNDCDFYMSAAEAKAYGLVDKVLEQQFLPSGRASVP